MIGRVIAIPTGRKGDYLDFWRFEKDNGQEIPNYGLRIAWNPVLKDRIKKILIMAKRDYLRDMELARKERVKILYREGKATRAVYTARRDAERIQAVYNGVPAYIKQLGL